MTTLEVKWIADNGFKVLVVVKDQIMCLTFSRRTCGSEQCRRVPSAPMMLLLVSEVGEETIQPQE